ncbi:MAG: DNA repair protein RecO [Deltaproteobacteria bacterium]|nr:DNA repair protein RecO [Deltaproteobacteria bacterium]
MSIPCGEKELVWYTQPVRLESTPAIVLRTREYGESDKIVTVLSRAAGKFSGIAKGAMRSQRRFPGTLELFSHVTLDFKRRPHSELAFLDRAVLLQPWPRLLSTLERFTAASHVVELADKVTVESEVGDDLYAIVTSTLARLNAAEPGPATLRLFELAALHASGYRPELVVCRGCAGPLASDRGPVRLVGGIGGVLCSQCRGAEEGGMLLSNDGLACLGHLQDAVTRAGFAGGHDSSAGSSGGPDARVGFANGRDAHGSANGHEPHDPWAVEHAVAARLTSRVEREMALALDMLLAPHLRGRLRSLELLGPVLNDRAGG